MIRGWMDGFLSVIGLAHWLGFYSALGGPLRGLHRRQLTLSAADLPCPALQRLYLYLCLSAAAPCPGRPAGHQRLCMHATHVCSISQVRTAYLLPTLHLHVQRTSQQLPSEEEERRIGLGAARLQPAASDDPRHALWSCRRCRRGPTCRWDSHACLVPRMRTCCRPVIRSGSGTHSPQAPNDFFHAKEINNTLH
jgi:hypothetical protein